MCQAFFILVMESRSSTVNATTRPADTPSLSPLCTLTVQRGLYTKDGAKINNHTGATGGVKGIFMKQICYIIFPFSPLLSRSVSPSLPGYPCEGKRIQGAVRTIKGVLRKSPGLFQKVAAAAALQMCCLLSRQRWDLAMLTLLLKWPPTALPFAALWWNPVSPFIPTCAPQIFKLGLHKHCCAGEMMSPSPHPSKPQGPFQSQPACIINLRSIGQMLPSQTCC